MLFSVYSRLFYIVFIIQLISLTQWFRCDDEGNVRKFVFVHQHGWQKHLLERYGGEMVLMDATHGTSLFALPLFFLSVPTNCGYIPVATLILEDERAYTIQIALEVFVNHCIIRYCVV